MEKWESRGEVDEIIGGIGEETGRDQRRNGKGREGKGEEGLWDEEYRKEKRRVRSDSI